MRSLTHPSDYFLHKILASWKLVISAVYFVYLWLSCSRCLFTQLNTHKKFWDFFVPIHDYAQHSGLKSKRCLHTLKSTCKIRSEFSSSTDCFRDIKKESLKHHLCWISIKTLTGSAFYLSEFQEMHWNCLDKSEVLSFFSWVAK